MMFTPLAIRDVILIQPKQFTDARGWFRETYRLDLWAAHGLSSFVQDNESLSTATGTVRGLHFQKAPMAQAKLIRCVSGAIYDVAVDIRPGSPTFAQHVGVSLDADAGEQLMIPAGFAHGFCTLSPNTLVQYKVSAPYAPACEGGIRWNDPVLGIDWPVTEEQAVLSVSDRQHPSFSEAELA